MIYLDNASTTRIYSSYIFEITQMLKKFGNPSNHYDLGFETKRIIEKARNRISESLNCEPEEIYFTSGASEGNAWALKQRKNCICSAYEHHNIINNPNAFIVDEDYLQKAYKKWVQGEVFIGSWKNFIYSHMLVNNETGEIFDIESFANYGHALDELLLFHSDMTQALGNVEIDMKDMSYVDIATFSGHKIHTPKGIGFIYFNKKTFNNSDYYHTIQPLIYGGGQENNKRAGTENVPYIHALGLAVESAVQQVRLKNSYCRILKLQLIELLDKTGIDFIIVSPAKSISSTVAFCIRNVESELIQSMLADHDIYVGTGSACNSGDKIDEEDTVLKAMKIPEDYKRGLIRVSFDKETNLSDIEEFVKSLKMVCQEIGVKFEGEN